MAVIIYLCILSTDHYNYSTFKKQQAVTRWQKKYLYIYNKTVTHQDPSVIILSSHEPELHWTLRFPRLKWRIIMFRYCNCFREIQLHGHFGGFWGLCCCWTVHIQWVGKIIETPVRITQYNSTAPQTAASKTTIQLKPLKNSFYRKRNIRTFQGFIVRQLSSPS